MDKLPPPLPPPARLKLRERRVDFAMLYREMHYCYGRLLGLDGIGLWSWYRLHQHGGGAYKELAGYGWTGQSSTMAAHGIKHKGTLRKIRDRLVEAELIVIHEAREVFSPEEIQELRDRARENGEMLSIQPASHLIFAQDPRSREDFVVWNEGQECKECPMNTSCHAYHTWRQRLGEGGSIYDLPGAAKSDPVGGAKIALQAGPQNAPQGGSKSDHEPDRTNHDVVVSHIEPFDVFFSDVEAENLRSSLAALGLRSTTVEELLGTPVETAYQLKHLVELKLSGKAPKSDAGWLRSAVRGQYRYQSDRKDSHTLMLFEESLGAGNEDVIEAELSPEERIWRTVLERLQTGMTRATYEKWFLDTSLRFVTEQQAIVDVTTPAAQEWLTKRFCAQMEHELANVLGRPIKLSVEVVEKIVPLGNHEPRAESA
jgi:hypothetical protein